MATVGDCIREGHELLLGRGIRTTLEWNPGNHFKDAGIRMAKGFVWLMKNNADYVELEVYENTKKGVSTQKNTKMAAILERVRFT